MSDINFLSAIALNIDTADGPDLIRAWHSYAGQISHHHADDSGREWSHAQALMPRARSIEVAIRNRGLPRPTGNYLMTDNDRIDWETGEWSPGWTYKANRQGARTMSGLTARQSSLLAASLMWAMFIIAVYFMVKI